MTPLLLLAALAAAPSQPPVLALIIGNNRSLHAARPDLRYADDDAIKYGRLFRQHSPTARVELLTRLDADTASLATDTERLSAAPTRSALASAVDRLAQANARWRAAGRRAELYVIFAGHGDQRDGRGWLELEDGPLRRADLVKVLEDVGAPRAHVLLDACNSFFVVNARRPGGRPWATSADAGLGLKAAGVDVGVFLSTSAEAEVFEWSQLRSGIFSHLVRSGLTGAADVDGDGAIGYRELEGFVEVAASGLTGTEYRPHLFVAAPSHGVMLARPAAPARKLTLHGGDGRVTIRDAHGVRWADVHLEPTFTAQVLAPEGELSLTAHTSRDDGRRHTREVLVAAEAPAVEWASAVPGASTARGPSLLATRLFEKAWGPRAMVAWANSAKAAPPKLYGVTRAQEARVLSQLKLMAGVNRSARLRGAFALSVIGAVLLAGGVGTLGFMALAGAPLALLSGAAGLAFATPAGVLSLIAIFGIAGGPALLAAAANQAFITTDVEDLYDDARDIQRGKGDRRARVSAILARLLEERDEASLVRTVGRSLAGALGIGVAALGVSLGALGLGLLLVPGGQPWALSVFALAVLFGGLGVMEMAVVGLDVMTGAEHTPQELVLDLIESDPERLPGDLLEDASSDILAF